MLLVLALLTTTAFETNLVQIKMASNAQHKSDALQQAHALVDALVMQRRIFSNVLLPGQTVCAVADTSPACDVRRLGIPAGAMPLIGDSRFFMVRQSPAVQVMPVMAEGVASSTVHYGVAVFEVHAMYDGRAARRGQADVTQGVMVLAARAGL
tara:strand:- start:32951 stop:33409 length:459 start_codon:yes stop_codon:yes gene_type:complete